MFFVLFSFCLLFSYLFFFFFFQAEDGIRDRDVTGVQTCALPIYVYLAPGRAAAAGGKDAGSFWESERDASPRAALGGPAAGQRVAARRRGWRSEERRVGKECRSRWSLYR